MVEAILADDVSTTVRSYMYLEPAVQLSEVAIAGGPWSCDRVSFVVNCNSRELETDFSSFTLCIDEYDSIILGWFDIILMIMIIPTCYRVPTCYQVPS